jgi:hypothetical protein
MALGSIVVRLTMNTADFETDTARAAKIAERRAKELDAHFRRAGVAIGLALSAAAIAAEELTRRAIDNADAMRDLSIRTGASTETLSAYGYAAEQTGTDVETLGKGLKVLAKNAADSLNPTSEQAKVFKALGVEVVDSHGKLRALSELIPDIADRFKAMEDGTTKAALAQALFGRAGLDLTEFLNSGSQGLSEFAKRAEDLGIIVDEKTAKAADNFNDSLGDLKKLLSGVGLGIAKELLPHLQDAVEELQALVKQGDLASNIASVLGAAFSAAAGLLSGYTKAVQLTTLAMENYSVVAGGVLEIQKNLMSFGFADGSVSSAIERIRLQKEASDREMARILAGPQKPTDYTGFTSGPTFQIPGLSTPFSMTTPRVPFAPAPVVDEAAVALALSNPTTGAAQLSDAEKAAKKLDDQYQDLLASQRREIALFGETSEAARVRYDTEFGALAGLSEEKKKQLIENAEWQDQLADTAALEQVWADAHDDAVQSMIDSWSKATDEMSVFAEEAGRNMQDAFADFLFDPLDDGFDGMVDNFAKALRRMAAEVATSQLFQALGKWGTANADSEGWVGALAGIAKSFFGGQRASGGRVSGSRIYEVAEGGNPELLRQNGRTYLIPGDDGEVVPASRGSMSAPAGSPSVSVNVYGASSQPQTSARMGPNGLEIDLFFKQAEQYIAGNIAQGASPVLTSLKARTGLKDTV